MTQPIAPAIVEALHRAVDEMGDAGTFRGYAPDLGYDFLREAIVENDYRAWGCAVEADEIFVSDGAKNATAAISRRFSGRTAASRCATRCTRSMWTPT